MLRNPSNWSTDSKNQKSRQWKVKALYEALEDEIGIDKIIDHLITSEFWSSIPELQDPRIVEKWLLSMKEPFLCIEPFLVKIAKSEGLEEKLKLLTKKVRAQ
jgi:hypothetical protein